MKAKLKVVLRFHEVESQLGFSFSRWNLLSRKWERVEILIDPDNQLTQLEQPLRVPTAPRYWLYRDCLVLEEDVQSEADLYVDLLEEIAASEQGLGFWDAPRKAAREKMLLDTLVYTRTSSLTDFHNDVHRTMRGRAPLRETELAARTPEDLVLQVKHLVLTDNRALEKIRREVAAFENNEKLTSSPREAISQQVRMYVWQRDAGKCVQCGGEERLEYDHIIPVAEGGSSTDRNIQLLCESCNRSKGRTIR